MQVAVDLVTIIAGVLLVAFHKPFAELVEAGQRAIGFHYDDRDRKAARVVSVLVGCVAVLAGLAHLLAVVF